MKNRLRYLDFLAIEIVLFLLLGWVFTSCGVATRAGEGSSQAFVNKWVSIAAGKSHSLAIRSDGTLWAWGANEVGQLGDGTTAEEHSPVQTGNRP